MFPAKYGIPVIEDSELYTNPESGAESYSVLPSTLKRTDFDPSLDMTIREDSGSGDTIIRIENLQRYSRSSSAKTFSFEFWLQAPSVGVSIILEELTCRMLLGDDTVAETPVDTGLSTDNVTIGAVEGG